MNHRKIYLFLAKDKSIFPELYDNLLDGLGGHRLLALSLLFKSNFYHEVLK